VAYYSYPPGWSGGPRRLMLYDLASRLTTVVCTDSATQYAYAIDITNQSLSSDGRYLAFLAQTSTLIAGDTNNAVDAFVYDSQPGVTVRVSVSSTGTQATKGSGVFDPSMGRTAISSDGRYVAFDSISPNLVAGDTNGSDDVFLHDCVTRSTRRISRNSLGYQIGDGGWFPAMSASGRYVSFIAAPEPYPNTADQVFVRDMSAHFRADVRTPVAPSKMSRKKSYTVHGYLKPRHVSGTYPVRIYKYRYVSGHWRSYGYVRAKASNYKSYTKYSAKLKLTKKGRWRVRAYAPTDAGHAASWSGGYDYATVK
jgi:hypothetical protein